MVTLRHIVLYHKQNNIQFCAPVNADETTETAQGDGENRVFYGKVAPVCRSVVRHSSHIQFLFKAKLKLKINKAPTKRL